MIWEYLYIFSSDLPRYQADGWELCGPMKGARYSGAHPDTVIVRRRVPLDTLSGKSRMEGNTMLRVAPRCGIN